MALVMAASRSTLTAWMDLVRAVRSSVEVMPGATEWMEVMQRSGNLVLAQMSLRGWVVVPGWALPPGVDDLSGVEEAEVEEGLGVEGVGVGVEEDLEVEGVGEEAAAREERERRRRREKEETMVVVGGVVVGD